MVGIEVIFPEGGELSESNRDIIAGLASPRDYCEGCALKIIAACLGAAEDSGQAGAGESPDEKPQPIRNKNIGGEEGRLILRLRAEGMTYKEVAAQVGRPWRTVYQYVKRAKKKNYTDVTDAYI
jgi:hypothetical protein